MFADRNCWKLGIKMFFGIAVAGLALCPKAAAQQLSACTINNSQPQPCIPKFVDQLPYLPLLGATAVTVGGNSADGYQIAAREILQPVLSTGTLDGSGNQLMTAVFAFGQTDSPTTRAPQQKFVPLMALIAPMAFTSTSPVSSIRLP